MPKGYVIFTSAIHDKDRYDRYVEKAVPTILQHGGRPLVAYDGPTVVEGRWHGTRTVVLEFDSLEAAHRWYRSPEYQAAAGERRASAEANVAIVGGFEMPVP
jgi:uncharacterized protein (DUF1330 family)